MMLYISADRMDPAVRARLTQSRGFWAVRLPWEDGQTEQGMPARLQCAGLVLKSKPVPALTASEGFLDPRLSNRRAP